MRFVIVVLTGIQNEKFSLLLQNDVRHANRNIIRQTKFESFKHTTASILPKNSKERNMAIGNNMPLFTVLFTYFTVRVKDCSSFVFMSMKLIIAVVLL